MTEDGECDPVQANPGTQVIKITDFDENPIPKWLNPTGSEEKGEGHTVEKQYENKQNLRGLNTLYFVNCYNEDQHVAVSFDITTEMWNEVGYNGEKSYLSVGEIELPSLYMVRSHPNCPALMPATLP